MHQENVEMKAYYAARAAYYDAVYDQPERRADIAFLRDWLPQRFEGREVIEVACGTGFWSQYIAPAAKRYVMTDGVQEPLDFAKQRPGVTPEQCFLADAYALPVSLGKFDGAFAGLWFSHVPKGRYEEFFASLHGRLLPDARVVFIDNSEVQCKDYPIVEVDADGNTYQDRPLRDGSSHRVLKNFPSEAELSEIAKTYGAARCSYRALANFWLFEYTLAG
jgi:demethylmenaquinone methyltransferase/2-methoxy-6-polyprenyl-1,4-benzoquinol methylase